LLLSLLPLLLSLLPLLLLLLPGECECAGDQPVNSAAGGGPG
jgi:hypothetical protein